MLFNFGKYKCLHTEHGILDVKYNMEDTVLGTTRKGSNANSEQCGIATSNSLVRHSVGGATNENIR